MMRRFFSLLWLLIPLLGCVGCEDKGNQGAARMCSGLRASLAPVDKRDFANRFIKAGWKIDLTVKDANSQDMGQQAGNVEVEVEVINNFNAATSCIGNQYGTELPYGNWAPPMPCFDLWAFNHKGNTPPAEGSLNGKQDPPGTKRYFRTDKDGKIQLDVLWELVGTGPANHLCALDITVIARVVRLSHPDPDMGYRLKFNWSFDSHVLTEGGGPLFPPPKFTPKAPGRQQLLELEDCNVGEPFTDTDGDGWPDWMDECPNSDQGAAGVCGCDQPVADDDNDFAFTCPSLAVQPAGTDQYPHNGHCSVWPCGQSPDLDGNGSVTMDDFGLLQRCYGHVVVLGTPDQCDRMDLDYSDHVDSGDADLMHHCQSSVGVPWDNHCLP